MHLFINIIALSIFTRSRKRCANSFSTKEFFALFESSSSAYDCHFFAVKPSKRHQVRYYSDKYKYQTVNPYLRLYVQKQIFFPSNLQRKPVWRSQFRHLRPSFAIIFTEPYLCHVTYVSIPRTFPVTNQ